MVYRTDAAEFDYETLAELELAKGGLESQAEYFDELVSMINSVIPTVVSSPHRVMGAFNTLVTQDIATVAKNLNDAVTAAVNALVAHRDELDELFQQRKTLLAAELSATGTTTQLLALADERAVSESKLNAALADSVDTVANCASTLRRVTWEQVTVTPVSERVPLWQNSELADFYWLLRNSSAAKSAALIAENPETYERLLKEYPLLLCQLSNLPTSEQDRINRKALKWAIKNPEAAYVAMGFNRSGLTVAAFKDQLRILRKQLKLADKNYTKTFILGTGLASGHSLVMQNSRQGVVNLSGFGRHEGAITAQLSFGDPQTADHLAVLVPGMYSTVAGAGELNTAALNLLEESQHYSKSVSVSVWFGYDSPDEREEPFMKRATAGGMLLSQDINQMQQLRLNNPPKTFTLITHSYGTTVGAEGIKRINSPVDTFITVGSAGLKNGTTADDLQTKRIAATTAEPEINSWGEPANWLVNPLVPNSLLNYLTLTALASDYIAPIGRTIGEHRVDPRNLTGAEVFSANRLIDEQQFVGTHSMISTDNNAVKGYFQEDTQSLSWMAKEITGGHENDK